MSKVVVNECECYEVRAIIDKLTDGMNYLGGWNAFLKPGMKVLLKVNLIGPKTSETAAITHTEFVRAMVRIVKSHDCEVWIGDSSGGAIAGISPTTQSFKVSGLEGVAADEGAKIKNFDAEGVVSLQPVSGLVDTMYLAKPIYDADLVINLPKLKTHSGAVYTGAVKNVFGCIPGLKKAEFHKLAPDPHDLGKVMCDIHDSGRFHLHIMDGIVAMQGEGPTAGKPYQASKILISTDPLALDTVAVRMLGLNVDDVPILKTAKERRLGNAHLDEIELLGDYEEVPALPGFALPKRFSAGKPRNYKAVVKVVDFLKTRPKINHRLCKDCDMCVESCPVDAINQETKSIDYEACIECMCCHELCLHHAVELKRTNWLAGLLMKLYRGRYR